MARGKVCNGELRMNLVKRESTSNGDCHWTWKLKPDHVADAGVHFLRDRVHGEHSGDRDRARGRRTRKSHWR